MSKNKLSAEDIVNKSRNEFKEASDKLSVGRASAISSLVIKHYNNTVKILDNPSLSQEEKTTLLKEEEKTYNLKMKLLTSAKPPQHKKKH